ncbi:hypothetical protein CCAX7_25740 [Capsulimonas corticalis]|uniref:Uncharacterized protein n=1 Tax=Capsulimonas corticalis TaxID=2219043 RepID=A0A9N7L1Q0_9BACT|nr:hypothetical protein CCAX7_25740 [Capsulimonas corticalis]
MRRRAVGIDRQGRFRREDRGVQIADIVVPERHIKQLGQPLLTDRILDAGEILGIGGEIDRGDGRDKRAALLAIFTVRGIIGAALAAKHGLNLWGKRKKVSNFNV